MEPGYIKMINESLDDLSHIDNDQLLKIGGGKAQIALAMVVGDLKGSSELIGKKIDILNEKIEKYSASNDKYSEAIKILTFF